MRVCSRCCPRKLCAVQHGVRGHVFKRCSRLDVMQLLRLPLCLGHGQVCAGGWVRVE
jgi:hypothetical protein